MVRTVRWLGVSAVALLLIGCPKKPVVSDAGPDAEPSSSATTEAAAPVADNTPANEADVTHYPGQNADNGDTITARMTVNARTEASTTGGKVVAPVKAGTQVQRLADHEGYDLVLFADPTDATRKIEGWAPQSAFGTVPHVVPMVLDGGTAPVVVADAGPKPPSKPLDVKKVNGACPGGYGSCGAMCRLTCSSDADCGLSTAHCTGGMCMGPGASPCAH